MDWVVRDHSDNLAGETRPVAQKKANALGLYDMSENVWEWVWDLCYREYDSSATDPIYVDASNAIRVTQGGGWDRIARYSRVSNWGRGNASQHGVSILEEVLTDGTLLKMT